MDMVDEDESSPKIAEPIQSRIEPLLRNHEEDRSHGEPRDGEMTASVIAGGRD